MLSIFDEGPFAPCPAPFNLAAHVLGRASERAAHPALEVLGANRAEVWSYARLEAAVRGTATGLLQAGLRPGDRVLMRLGNDVAFPLAYLGAITAGLVPVPTSPLLTDPEVARILADLAPAAVLTAPDVACPDKPGAQRIGTAELATWRDLPPAPFATGDPDRMAYVIYTSGTSGTPRAVAHAHRAIWARQMMMQGWYGLTPEDRLLHAGAFNWTYTLGTGLMDPWTMGATALIPAPGTDPGDLGPRLAACKATIFAAAPGVYRKVLKSDLPPLPHLRHGLSAGEKLSRPIRDAWHAATGTQIYEAFGMSECSTFLSAAPGVQADGGSLGRPQPGRRVAILGRDGLVPRGTPGEIAIDARDPGLMLGYLGAPEETASRFRDGWFLTGDQGQMAEDGQIAYLGRADDMMNAGGVRVSPLEVEAALADLPGIAEIGVTEAEVKDGVRVIAAVYAGPAPLPEPDLKRAAAERLARYKQPRIYVYVPHLPRNPNGKLLRARLRGLVQARRDGSGAI